MLSDIPAILYLKHGHFVVLEKLRAGKSGLRYTLLDPSYGKVCLSEEKLEEKWLIAGKGVAVVMSVLIVRARIRKKIAGSLSGKSNFLRDDAVSVGDTGMAETGLAPSGMARIGHERVPVTALEGEIEQGADVEVVLVEEGRIYVKPAGEDF